MNEVQVYGGDGVNHGETANDRVANRLQTITTFELKKGFDSKHIQNLNHQLYTATQSLARSYPGITEEVVDITDTISIYLSHFGKHMYDEDTLFRVQTRAHQAKMIAAQALKDGT